MQPDRTKEKRKRKGERKTGIRRGPTHLGGDCEARIETHVFVILNQCSYSQL